MKSIVTLLLFVGIFQSCGSHNFKKDSEQTKEIIQAWIKKYAKYPDTYVPVSFSDFVIGCEENVFSSKKEHCTYSCKHQFRLKNLDGVTEECIAYFTANDLNYVTIIEKERSDTFDSWPPRVELFMTKFGRTLTDKDKKEIQKISDEQLTESLEEFMKK